MGFGRDAEAEWGRGLGIEAVGRAIVASSRGAGVVRLAWHSGVGGGVA